MMYFVLLIVGMVVGAASVFIIGWQKWQRIELQRRDQEQQTARIRESVAKLKEKEERQEARIQEAAAELKKKEERHAALVRASVEELESRERHLQEQHAAQVGESIAKLEEREERHAAAIQESLAELKRREQHLQERHAAQVQESLAEWKKKEEAFDAQRREFEQRVISYKELQNENALLKQDLQNIDVNLRKLQLDTDLQREAQAKLDQRGQELASRFLKDTIKWVGNALNQNNYVASKQRIQDVISRCREIGFVISEADENRYFDELKREYELMVRAAIEREEQARIKARMREEEQLKREVERELKQLERERLAIQAALEKAMADTKEEHSEEIERLKARLSEAEAKAQRAKSQAEMTKAGNVYVISNIGSFGEDVFKIGMTRRLEPLDRIAELGDASVPFPFDVHMMISCDDAPALENALHHALHRSRLNKVNPRKEYFRATIDEIKAIVEQNHGEVSYVADAEALQYRQSISMTDEEADYIEKVFEKASEKQEDAGED